jgi:hypothetical protein
VKGGGSSAKALSQDEVNTIKKRLLAASYAQSGSDIAALFARLDKDHNGVLSYTEMYSVVQRLTPGLVTKRQFVQLLYEVDKDGDGTVDYEEFSGWLLRTAKPQTTKNRNRNGNGSNGNGGSGSGSYGHRGRMLIVGASGGGVQAVDDAMSGAFVGGLRANAYISGSALGGAAAMREKGRIQFFREKKSAAVKRQLTQKQQREQEQAQLNTKLLLQHEQHRLLEQRRLSKLMKKKEGKRMTVTVLRKFSVEGGVVGEDGDGRKAGTIVNLSRSRSRSE